MLGPQKTGVQSVLGEDVLIGDTWRISAGAGGEKQFVDRQCKPRTWLGEVDTSRRFTSVLRGGRRERRGRCGRGCSWAGEGLVALCAALAPRRGELGGPRAEGKS